MKLTEGTLRDYQSIPVDIEPADETLDTIELIELPMQKRLWLSDQRPLCFQHSFNRTEENYQI